MANGGAEMSQGSVPVPDPTKLTTDAVDKATDTFRRELSFNRELIETRLAAMDKATKLLADTLNHVPTETDKAVSALRELLGARIDGMDTATRLLADQVNQIPSETDKRIIALKEILLGEIHNVQDVASEKFSAIDGTFGSNALALTAALAAQKEAAAEQNKSNTLAINKSEQATKEASLANVAQTSNSLASQAATIADLKDRLVRLESGGLALSGARADQRADRAEARDVGSVGRLNMNTIFTAIFAVTSVVTLILYITKK
jgi:hypothetical protein